jgi:hypothetical protein
MREFAPRPAFSSAGSEKYRLRPPRPWENSCRESKRGFVEAEALMDAL